MFTSHSKQRCLAARDEWSHRWIWELSLKESQKNWILIGNTTTKKNPCQVRVRLREACLLCPCVGWLMWECFWRNFLIKVMSGSWSSTHDPALFCRRNLRCSTIALCRVSRQLFLFSVRREISFFSWANGRPELLSNCYILSCNSRTFMWTFNSGLPLAASHRNVFTWLFTFLLCHPGKSMKAWQTGRKDLLKN